MTVWMFVFDCFKQFDTEASFKAYFSVESPPEFTVTPTDGMLEAYGSEGTNFVVSFTPKGEHSCIREFSHTLTLTKWCMQLAKFTSDFPGQRVLTCTCMLRCQCMASFTRANS